ncbi:transposase [Sodalis praecaptivus]|uniref:transposase n=1 Tax=Sodalis praecaptivus TaxID=1239307 RepID=UPI0037D9BE8E
MHNKWACQRGNRLNLSCPGTPTDNATLESFNGRLRQECLNKNGFMSLEDARCKHYNQSRPQFCTALDDLIRIHREKSAGCQNIAGYF